MLVVTGLSWLVFWLMASVFEVEVLKAALATGLVFTLLGLLVEAAPKFRPNLVKG